MRHGLIAGTSHFRFPYTLQRAGRGNGKWMSYTLRRPRDKRRALPTLPSPILLFGPPRSPFLRPGRSSSTLARAAAVKDGASAPPSGLSLMDASTTACSCGTGRDRSLPPPLNRLAGTRLKNCQPAHWHTCTPLSLVYLAD